MMDRAYDVLSILVEAAVAGFFIHTYLTDHNGLWLITASMAIAVALVYVVSVGVSKGGGR